MIDFIKRHKVTFLTLFVGICIFGYGVWNRMQKDLKEQKEYDAIVNKIPEYATQYPRPEKMDTLSVYFSELDSSNVMQSLGFVGSLLAIIPCCFLFYRHYKTGFIQNELTRISYKKWLFHMLFKMYGTSLILVITVFIGIFLFYLYCGNFDIQYTIEYFSTSIPYFSKVLNPNAKQIYFLFWYLMNFVCFGIFLAKLSMITCKKAKNVFINIVLAYVLFLGIDLCNELFYFILDGSQSNPIYIGKLLIPSGINNLWRYFEGAGDPKIIFPFMFILGMLSLIGVFIFYFKKESVLLECE